MISKKSPLETRATSVAVLAFHRNRGLSDTGVQTQFDRKMQAILQAAEETRYEQIKRPFLKSMSDLFRSNLIFQPAATLVNSFVPQLLGR